MPPIFVRPERVWPKLSSIQGIRANLVNIVPLEKDKMSSSKNQFREMEIFENQLQIDTLMQKLRCHNFTTVFILIDTNPIGKFILETFQGIKTWHITNHLKVSSKDLQLADQLESWILNLIL